MLRGGVGGMRMYQFIYRKVMLLSGYSDHTTRNCFNSAEGKKVIISNQFTLCYASRWDSAPVDKCDHVVVQRNGRTRQWSHAPAKESSAWCVCDLNRLVVSSNIRCRRGMPGQCNVVHLNAGDTCKMLFANSRERITCTRSVRKLSRENMARAASALT